MRFLTIGYVIALCLIFVVAVLKYTVTSYFFNKQYDSAAIVNMSGQQRMLSQRIALFSLLLKEEGYHNNDVLVKKLSTAIDKFESNHNALITEDVFKSELLKKQNIQNVYFGMNYNLHFILEEYVKAARSQIDKNVDDDIRSKNMNYIINTGPEDLLEGLHKIVELHEENIEEGTEFIKTLLAVFLIFTIFVLITEALLLFKPMVKNTQKYIHILNKRETEIENQNNDFKKFSQAITHNMNLIVSDLNRVIKMPEQDLKKMDVYSRSTIEYAQRKVIKLNSLIQSSKIYLQVIISDKDEKVFSSKTEIENTLENLKQAIQAQNATVRMEGKFPYIYYDTNSFSFIFKELITNALKYFPSHEKQCKIIISSISKTDMYQFTIEDNGLGISTTKIKDVFDIFKKIKKINEMETFELGLPMVKNIVQRYGGDIKIDTKLDTGTKVIFTVPK